MGGAADRARQAVDAAWEPLVVKLEDCERRVPLSLSEIEAQLPGPLPRRPRAPASDDLRDEAYDDDDDDCWDCEYERVFGDALTVLTVDAADELAGQRLYCWNGQLDGALSTRAPASAILAELDELKVFHPCGGTVTVKFRRGSSQTYDLYTMGSDSLHWGSGGCCMYVFLQPHETRRTGRLRDGAQAPAGDEGA